MTWIELIRWLHLLTGASWVGAVLVVVFVLGPALRASSPTDRATLLIQVFPRVFRLASAVIIVTFVSGATLFTHHYGLNPTVALDDARGTAIVAGGLLGAAIGAFHFLVEPRLESRIADVRSDSVRLERIVRLLRVIPRAGLGVLIVVTLLMVAGARGW